MESSGVITSERSGIIALHSTNHHFRALVTGREMKTFPETPEITKTDPKSSLKYTLSHFWSKDTRNNRVLFSPH